jgi:hypothetical protein
LMVCPHHSFLYLEQSLGQTFSLQNSFSSKITLFLPLTFPQTYTQYLFISFLLVDFVTYILK